MAYNYEWHRQWYLKQKEKGLLEKLKKQYRSEKGRRKHLATYGLTLEQFNEMMVAQNYRCAICRTDKPAIADRKKHFCVDHCHHTGKVRGLLCDECNNGIGRLKDSSDLVEAALNYLKPRKFEAGNTQWL